jgi:hypothetical protein
MHLFENLTIPSPKQSRSSRRGWDAFFPYYAGYPSSFASAVISSAGLDPSAVVLDPWNGSGTTTQVASKLGFRAIGCDINPVMVIVSRARCLLPADGDSIEPIAKKVIRQASTATANVADDDFLLGWFDTESAVSIRCIEASVREHLLGAWTLRPDGTHFECMSSLAATFYVALFLTCRSLVSSFQSSNPTWLRRRRTGEAQISVDRCTILNAFKGCLDAMSSHLAVGSSEPALELREQGTIDIHLTDSTKLALPEVSVDFVLTSPPYCTRIDYTAATRIELAVIAPLLNMTTSELSRQMIGSTRVPVNEIKPDPRWGNTCTIFLAAVKSHTSKASSGYYLKTHLDYFEKLSSSINRVRAAMKPGAMAVFVVQDSYYKDVHNDLPTIVSEMGTLSGLAFLGAKEFRLARSMSGVNPYTRTYKRRTGAVEKVLCFKRQ